MLCVTNDAAWLIEVKDYRRHSREKGGTIEDEAAKKVRDTLACLAAASANGSIDERDLASKALDRHQWRVVLHIEQADDLAYNISNVQIRLQKKLRAVDNEAIVTNSKYTRPQLPWTVAHVPTVESSGSLADCVDID